MQTIYRFDACKWRGNDKPLDGNRLQKCHRHIKSEPACKSVRYHNNVLSFQKPFIDSAAVSRRMVQIADTRQFLLFDVLIILTYKLVYLPRGVRSVIGQRTILGNTRNGIRLTRQGYFFSQQHRQHAAQSTGDLCTHHCPTVAQSHDRTGLVMVLRGNLVGEHSASLCPACKIHYLISVPPLEECASALYAPVPGGVSRIARGYLWHPAPPSLPYRR